MWGYNENISGGAGMTNATSVKDGLLGKNQDSSINRYWFW